MAKPGPAPKLTQADYEIQFDRYISLNPRPTLTDFAKSLGISQSLLSTNFAPIKRKRLKDAFPNALEIALSNTTVSLNDTSLDDAFRAKLNLDALKIIGQLDGMGNPDKTVNTTINLGVSLFASEDKEKIKAMFSENVIDDTSNAD